MIAVKRISQQTGEPESYWYFRFKNEPYLDNFLTKCYSILVYSGDLGSESPEYGKICMGLVRKLSRYGRILDKSMGLKVRK